jgi:hypothetical protein
MNDITNDHCTDGRSPLGRSRLRQAGLLAVAAVGVALLAAACSGVATTVAATAAPTTAAPTTAAPTTAAPTTAAPAIYQLAVAYAQCMRTHGEPNWPDPASDGNFAGNINTSTARYLSANGTCGHLLPNGGVLTQAQTQQALATLSKYAACMRSHGIPKYPDPDSRYVQAGLTGPGYVSVQALNITMQQFSSATQACLNFQPGYGRTS